MKMVPGATKEQYERAQEQVNGGAFGHFPKEWRQDKLFGVQLSDGNGRKYDQIFYAPTVEGVCANLRTWLASSTDNVYFFRDVTVLKMGPEDASFVPFVAVPKWGVCIGEKEAVYEGKLAAVETFVNHVSKFICELPPTNVQTGPTLDEVIHQLEILRQQCGGATKVVVRSNYLGEISALNEVRPKLLYPHPYYVNRYETGWNKCGHAKPNAAPKTPVFVIMID